MSTLMEAEVEEILPQSWKESQFTIEQLSGLGDWISDLFGKPQSWYDRVGRDQRDITVLLAEVSAIGQSAWDGLQQTLATALAQGYQMPVERFPNYQWIMDDLLEQAKILLITKSVVPTDAEISTAESRIYIYRQAVDYAKRILPEMASAAEAEAARIRAALPEGSLRSPAEVGVETFKAELERRAKNLAAGAFGLGTIALFIFAGIAAARMFGGGR